MTVSRSQAWEKKQEASSVRQTWQRTRQIYWLFVMVILLSSRECTDCLRDTKKETS